MLILGRRMAAVFNFLGVIVMTAFNATVAMTITNMVNFEGDDHQALIGPDGL